MPGGLRPQVIGGAASSNGFSRPRDSPITLPQHPDQHRSCLVLLRVDQELCEGAALRVAPELADPLGAGAGPSASRRSRSRRSSSSDPIEGWRLVGSWDFPYLPNEVTVLVRDNGPRTVCPSAAALDVGLDELRTVAVVHSTVQPEDALDPANRHPSLDSPELARVTQEPPALAGVRAARPSPSTAIAKATPRATIRLTGKIPP